jgi:hypothetical protein
VQTVRFTFTATATRSAAPRWKFPDAGLGSHVFTLLEGARGKPSAWVPGRPALKWMRVSTDKGRRIDADDLGRRVAVNPGFAAKLYDEIKPGTTVIVTDEPVARKFNRDFTIISN